MPADFTTDYLVIGAGVAGLGFTDELLTRTSATITIVDKRDSPGGHWNDAYPFVKLHGPANMYGFESTKFGSEAIDQHGLNKGFMTLASGAEVLAYCKEVLNHRFLTSGRVTYLPSSEYLESEGVVQGLLSGVRQTVDVKKKVVDARYAENVIPLTHKRSFTTASSVNCIPPNSLPKLASGFQNFTVLGAGKTAVDTCVWLLENGVDPQHIRWVIANDYWYLNRAGTQFATPFFDPTIALITKRFEAMAEATGPMDFAYRMEKAGFWHRLDPAVEATNFHSALVAPAEMDELRKITDVVRKGYVTDIQDGQIVLTKGTIPSHPNTLYIDCTAFAFPGRPDVPIWQPNKLVLQLVKSAMPCLTIAIIAFVESLGLSDQRCNDLLKPMAVATTLESYIIELATDLLNSYQLSKYPPTRKWSAESRLDVAPRLLASVKPEDGEMWEKVVKLRKALGPGSMNIMQLATDISAKRQSSI